MQNLNIQRINRPKQNLMKIKINLAGDTQIVIVIDKKAFFFQTKWYFTLKQKADHFADHKIQTNNLQLKKNKIVELTKNISKIIIKLKKQDLKTFKIMKKIQLKKDTKTQQVLMTLQNLKICAQNQQGFEHLYLNDSLHLQYCSFSNIDNLSACVNTETETQRDERNKSLKQKLTYDQLKQDRLIQNLKSKGINTLFLNNNVIVKIQNLHTLKSCLKILNLSFNRISKFQGLRQLHELQILDLSHNKLSFIGEDEVKGLCSLTRLNLNSNFFENKEGVQAIKELKNTLQIFQMNNNQLFQPEGIQILSEIFVFMQKLKVLFFKDTQFARKTTNYRKQTVYYIPSLTFLDDRPVTEEQKLLVNAWKKGGITEEREARKLIVQKKQQKNKNIILEIQERNKSIEEKVQKIYQIKAKKSINELKILTNIINKQDFDLKDYDEQTLIKVKSQQLQKYLRLLKQQCRGLDLDKQLGLNEDEIPKMLIENRTPECIYIYNVSEKQLEMIKKKHYPNQTLPIIAKNYVKPAQVYWLQDYDQILQKIHNICKGNWQLIEPSFNLQIYEFDQRAYRKIRRFSKQQLIERSKIFLIKDEQNKQNITNTNKPVNSLDSLD